MSMTEFERKLADLIWDNEPITSGDLVKLCESTLQWKKSTTYTMLKRICEQQLFQNENACVTSLVSRDEYLQNQGEQFLEQNFGGSMPSFLAAFMDRRKLTRKQIKEIRDMIDRYEEDQQCWRNW